MRKTVSLNELVTCVFEFWSPKIGDPTAIGWLTVAVYALTAILAMVVFARQVQMPILCSVLRAQVLCVYLHLTP